LNHQKKKTEKKTEERAKSATTEAKGKEFDPLTALLFDVLFGDLVNLETKIIKLG